MLNEGRLAGRRSRVWCGVELSSVDVDGIANERERFFFGKGCWCFCYFLALWAMFTVYTVRVIHTFFASPNRSPPALIQHHKSDPLCWERRGAGGDEVLEWELLYSDEEESWKRFSWYDEVNYFIFMLSSSSLFLLYCCLLPQLMLELVTLWCFVCFSWGFSHLLSLLLLLYEFIQFLLHSGIKKNGRDEGWGKDFPFLRLWFFVISSFSSSRVPDGTEKKEKSEE